MPSPRRRQATAILALVAMAIVVVAGLLHDPHAWCVLDTEHAPTEHDSGFGHCPACELAKSLALAAPPLAAEPTARPSVVAIRSCRSDVVFGGSRHEVTARPRAPPASPNVSSQDG